MQIQPDWAPLGAARFREMIEEDVLDGRGGGLLEVAVGIDVEPTAALFLRLPLSRVVRLAHGGEDEVDGRRLLAAFQKAKL